MPLCTEKTWKLIPGILRSAVTYLHWVLCCCIVTGMTSLTSSQEPGWGSSPGKEKTPQMASWPPKHGKCWQIITGLWRRSTKCPWFWSLWNAFPNDFFLFLWLSALYSIVPRQLILKLVFCNEVKSCAYNLKPISLCIWKSHWKLNLRKNNIVIHSRMKAVVVYFIPAGMCQIS